MQIVEGVTRNARILLGITEANAVTPHGRSQRNNTIVVQLRNNRQFSVVNSQSGGERRTRWTQKSVWVCSHVTAMEVRSLALLQLVNRPPFKLSKVIQQSVANAVGQ